ncbi:uncharacterized protein METZ01_LOCUS444967, partial [marine metagenome]
MEDKRQTPKRGSHHTLYFKALKLVSKFYTALGILRLTDSGVLNHLDRSLKKRLSGIIFSLQLDGFMSISCSATSSEKMKKTINKTIFQILGVAAILGMTIGAIAAPKKLLVVTVTKGFRHGSIPTAEKVLGQLAKSSGAFEVDYVRNDGDMKTKMTLESLKKLDGVIFANTTGDLPLPDREGFVQWVKSGKAFIGMH